MFVVDASTSIEDPEYGGSPGGVNKLARFAANMVRELDDNVFSEGIRIAAVTFASNAKVEFAFAGGLGGFSPNAEGVERTADTIADALETIEYTQGPNVHTNTNIHMGLQTVRKFLIDVNSGYRGQALHVIVLTDGNAQNTAGTAQTRLEQELARFRQLEVAGVQRWAFGVGTQPNFSTLAKIAPTHDTRRTIDGADSSGIYETTAATIIDENHFCETTTVTTSPTTTQTTTPCSEVRADLVFVIDASASVLLGTTGTPCDVISVVQKFTEAVILTLGSFVSEDGIRVAAVTYSDTGAVAFDFATYDYDADEIATALRHLNPPVGQGTLAHTAYETVVSDLLVVGGSNGFRHYAAPVIVATVSDGSTRVPQNNTNALVEALDAPGLNGPEVTRLAFDTTGNQDRAVLEQMAGGSSAKHIGSISCAAYDLSVQAAAVGL